MVHIIRYNCQDCAKLLVLLLEPQLLIHVGNALLKSGLERGNLVAQLLFLLLRGVFIFQSVLQVVDSLSSLLTVFSKTLHFAAALHTSRHLHATVHLVGDLSERGHVFTRVVTKVESTGMQDLCSIELYFAILVTTLLAVE